MKDIMRSLKALADETRFTIVKLLVGHDYCVGALARRLNLSESATSQHLKVLRTAGFVKGEKRGYYTHYWVDREQLKATANAIIQLSCVPPAEDLCPHHSRTGQTCCREQNRSCESQDE